MTTGIGYRPLVTDRGLTLDDQAVVFLHRVHLESNPRLAILFEGVEFKGVQAGGSGSRVDFRFYGRQSQLWQVYPFTPSKYG
jgi:hypothetical protein